MTEGVGKTARERKREGESQLRRHEVYPLSLTLSRLYFLPPYAHSPLKWQRRKEGTVEDEGSGR